MKHNLLLLLLTVPAFHTISLLDTAGDQVTAEYKNVVRMGVRIADYTKLEISAKPLLMVVESESVDKTSVGIEISVGGRGWVAVDTQPSVRGGVYTWTVATTAPCQDHRVRLWLEGKDRTQISFEFPGKVEGISQALLTRAGYRPGKVRGVEMVEVEDMVEMRWEESPCAEMYDITYQRVGGGEPMSLQTVDDKANLAIQACTEYDIKISASTASEYSDDTIATILTQPNIDAADILEPEVVTTTHGLTVRWKGYEELPCIKTYIVTICKEGNDCPEMQTIERDDSLEFLEFVSTVPLSPCHDYSLHMKPLYPGKEMQEKVISFRTSSPAYSGNLSISLDSVMPGSISWGGVQCATQYLLYLKENSGDWLMVGSTSKTYYSHSVTPCTQYRYGVRVVVGEVVHDLVHLGTPVISGLGTAEHYDSPNTRIVTTEDSARISWEHRVCIDSYRVQACTQESDCYQEQVIVDDSENNETITTAIDTLQPCTQYSLHIYPSTSEGEYSSSPLLFLTGNPTPVPPSDLDLTISSTGQEVVLSWSRAQCATGYKIHQRLEHSDTVVEWVHDNIHTRELRLESPEPCVTYSYSISTLILSYESDPTSWLDIPTPPRYHTADYLVIQSTYNGTVTFRLSNKDRNKRCRVEMVQVRHGTEMEIIDPADIDDDGDISINVDDEGGVIAARIKYQGYDEWSDWITSDLPVSKYAQQQYQIY